MRSKRELKEFAQEDFLRDSQLPRLFNVLGDENRWRIFVLLLRNQDLCVTELARILNISVPAVSQQLRILEMGGLVARQRDGQKICYVVQKQNLLTKLIIRMAEAWQRNKTTGDY